jgi:hypothetical protein
MPPPVGVGGECAAGLQWVDAVEKVHQRVTLPSEKEVNRIPNGWILNQFSRFRSILEKSFLALALKIFFDSIDPTRPFGWITQTQA